MTESNLKKQSLLLENRNYLKLSGVESVINLTETDAGVVLSGEVLVIKGSNLKAEKLSVETGELVLTGDFYSFKYEVKKEKQGFFKRIFK